MPDKMMRISGRGTDGTAKAIQTDIQGKLNTRANQQRQPFTTGIIEKGTTLRSGKLDSLGYKYGNFTARFGDYRQIRISIIDIDIHAGVVTERKRVVFDGAGTHFVSVDYEIHTPTYYIEIEAVSAIYLYGRSQETLSDFPLKKDNPTTKRRIFDVKVLANGKKERSSELDSYGYKYANLVLMFVGERAFKVSIIDMDKRSPVTQENKRVVFDGVAEKNVSIDYEILSDTYHIEVEATSSYGLSIGGNSFETLTNFPSSKNELIELKKEIGNLANKITTNNTPSEVKRTPKFPSKQLIFKDLNLNAQTFTKGTDDCFYIVHTDGVLKKYESIVDDSEPLETGLTWDESTHGSLVYLFVIDNGVVFFSNFEEGDDSVPRIYRADNINGDGLKLVYEDSTTRSSVWSRHFGVDHYYNGNSYFLAGLYSSGDPATASRDLLLSTDNGNTFKTVKQTTNLDESGRYNSHWHDVSIDAYHGLLWATEGDGAINRHIWYSEDMGKNWTAIADDIQPTSIMPYPDKVLFGRDGSIVGFDGLRYPDTITDLNRELIKPFREFKSQSAIPYFAMKPVFYENETYSHFFLYNTGNTPMIVGSGDFGETWHGLWFDEIQRGKVYNFMAIDEKHIYAYHARNSSNGIIVYAEKPKWI